MGTAIGFHIREKRVLYLLLGEVCETVHNSGLKTRVASIVAEVAAQIGAIIADPLSQGGRREIRGIVEIIGLN